jgi:hypothetical protein
MKGEDEHAFQLYSRTDAEPAVHQHSSELQQTEEAYGAARSAMLLSSQARRQAPLAAAGRGALPCTACMLSPPAAAAVVGATFIGDCGELVHVCPACDVRTHQARPFHARVLAIHATADPAALPCLEAEAAGGDGMQT